MVSPDGATAAVLEAGRYGHVSLKLLDLASGAVTTIDAPVTQASSSQTLAWSPDSRWLFVADAGGQVLAVNQVNDRVESLGVPLPDLTQITVRLAPG